MKRNPHVLGLFNLYRNPILRTDGLQLKPSRFIIVSMNHIRDVGNTGVDFPVFVPCHEPPPLHGGG